MAEQSEPSASAVANPPSPETHLSSTSSSQESTCAQCQKSLEPSLKQCLKCHSVSYCSKDCQKAHFKTHKKVCASLAQEYTKTHEPKMASRAPAKGGERDRGLQKWQFDT